MEARNDLPIDALVDSFMASTRDEDTELHNALAELETGSGGKRSLAGVLGRFDPHNKGQLDPKARLFAARILKRLHKPQAETLVLLNKVLDYLDFDGNSQLDESELEQIVEIFELFGNAESDNGLMSQRELGMLYAVLRHIDQNSNQKLDAGERTELRKLLDNPEVFLAEQQRSNPLMAEFKD